MDRQPRGSRGQGVVELALILPFMLLVCLGIVDFARIYYLDVVAINAARSGARVAADRSTTATQIRSAVKTDATPVVVSDSNILISPITRSIGSDVTVTVQYSFVPITPLIGSLFPGGQLTVNREAVMEVLY